MTTAESTWRGMQVVSRGANRVCVQDPALPGHCLKYELPPLPGARRRWRRLIRHALSRHAAWLGINALELRAYGRLRSQLGSAIDAHVAECIGLVATPHGDALRVRTVADAAGMPAPSLHALLEGRAPGAKEIPIPALLGAVDRLEAWLLGNLVPLFDLNPGNFVVVEDATRQPRLVCVDVKSVLARKEAIPLSRMSRRWAQRKLRRRLDRLRERIAASGKRPALATDTTPI